jgi:phosphoglycolate phosphatase
MTAYKAVLFDLDGTLLDTLDDLAGAANQVLEKRGLPVHPREAYKYFVGDGLQVLLERIVPAKERDPALLNELAQDFRQVYGQTWQVHSRPYPEIDSMLAILAGTGLRLAVLSNKPHDFTLLCVNNLLPEHSFDLVLGQREGVAKKPDPAGALEVAHSLSLAPEQFLYLGDTAVDMETAKRAGMCAVGVLWGFRDEVELRDAGAEHILHTPMEALHLLA